MTSKHNIAALLLITIGLCTCGGGGGVDETVSTTATVGATPGDLACTVPAIVAVPTAGPGMKIGTNFWDLTFRGGVTWDDVFLPGVDFSTVCNPWNPVFLDELRHYKALRFMDFGKINVSIEQYWVDRTSKTDPRPGQEKLAYEWMIDLCNRTGADMWVNLPTRADDAYAFELAQLIKANLDPSLSVYVEWSNETWNGFFDQPGFGMQQQYSIDQGMALGLDPDPRTAGRKFHVYRALRLFKQFDAVFGTGSPRIVRVIAGQSANTFLTGIHLAALADATINPTGMVVDAYGIAPYFGSGIDGSAPGAITQLAARVAGTIADVSAQHALIAPTGMQLIAYEGGQHVNTNADVVNAMPEMYAIYTDYLNGIAPYLTFFGHYTHNGQWGGIGAWGAESYVGQPLSEAHKLRAILDWISAHP